MENKKLKITNKNENSTTHNSKLDIRSQIAGSHLFEYLEIKNDLGLVSDGEMVRWLIHRVWKDHYKKLNTPTFPMVAKKKYSGSVWICSKCKFYFMEHPEWCSCGSNVFESTPLDVENINWI